LSSQPPGVDLPDAERATVAEVVEVFRPKVPSLRTPSVETMRESRARAATGERTHAAYRWPNFSHNVSGLILLGMSLYALAGFASGRGWGRPWALGLLAPARFTHPAARA